MSSKGNILCRLIKIELYKIFAIINRAIKGLHCTFDNNDNNIDDNTDDDEEEMAIAVMMIIITLMIWLYSFKWGQRIVNFIISH